MDFDVFISYHTKSSTHITEAVCNALESKKIKCWYAPRNIAGSYAKSIVDAIGRCKIFLLILNKEASYSEDVLNEINLAVERVRKGEEIAIIPFHISEEDISPDAKYYLGRIHWVDAINPPMEKRINELVSRIAYILNKNVDSNFELKQEDCKLNSNYSLSVGNFIGRKEELVELEENLTKYGKVFVKGMGGIGKSELVRKYINDHKEEYNTIIFAVYENNLIETVIKDEYFKITNFARMLDENGKQEDNETYFKRKMEKIYQLADEKTLIVIDNFDVMDDSNLKDILKGNYHLIFTTRNDFKQYKLPILELKPMTDMDDLLKLFQESYMIKINDEDVNIVKNIIELIGRHTLTVQLIASVMQEMRIKPRKMFEELNAHGINNEFQGEVVHNMQNYDSIYQCLSVLFKVSDLTEEEKNILKLLTVFPISGIDFDDFMELCEIENGMTINRLIKRSFILHDYTTDLISLHPLISSLVENEFPLTLDEAKILIHNLKEKNDWNMLIEDKEKYYKISLCVYNKFPCFDISTAFDFMIISNFFRDFYKIRETKCILLRAKDFFEKDEDKYLHELNKVYSLLGYFYYVIEGNSELDEEYILKRISLLEGKKEYLIHLAYAYRDITEKCIIFKDLEKAKKYIEKSYIAFCNSPETTDVYWGGFYSILSKLYIEMEEYEKALDAADKAYTYLYNFYQKENGDTSTTIRLKGLINMKLGNYEEAIKYLEKALELRKEYCNEYNAPVMRVREPLIEAYMLNGEYEKAKRGFEEFYDIVKNYYVSNEKWLERIKEKIEICNKELLK